MAIFNKYKDTLDNLINSSDIKFSDYPNFLNWPELIDKRSQNALKSRSGISHFLEDDYLDKDILIMLLEPALKIEDSLVYQCYNIAILGPKNKRT